MRARRTGAVAARAVATVIFLSAALVLQGGCLFSPRDPDGPPDDENDIPWVTPTDTDKVLANLSAALAGAGSQNYLDCFTEDFEFHVDPQDSLDAGQEGYDRYAEWTKEDEGVAINSIFLESAVGIDVSFVTETEPDESLEETYRREDYELTIVWQSGAHNPGEQVTYRGRATIWMRRDETERWAIFKWVDRRAPNPGGAQTWGVLRGDYRD